MNDQDFLKLINKSGVKNIIIGIFILAFGAFIIWLQASGVDKQGTTVAGSVVLYTLAGLCLLIGFMLIYLPVKASSQIKNGKHPLVNAINNNDSGYVIWFYEYVVQVKGGGTAHQVWVYGQDKKRYTISTKRVKTTDVLEYLAGKFPSAMCGYSKELEAAYKQKISGK